MCQTRNAFMLNQIDTKTAMAWVPNGPDSESDRLIPCSLLQRRPDVNLHVGGDGPWGVQWEPGVGRGEHAGKCPHAGRGRSPGPRCSPPSLGPCGWCRLQEVGASREHSNASRKVRARPGEGPWWPYLGPLVMGTKAPRGESGPQQ